MLLLLNGSKIVVPLKLRNEMPSLLHEWHLGACKTKTRVRQMLYCSGINNDIENILYTNVVLAKNIKL